MSLKAYVMIEGALQIVVISIKAAHNTFLKITSKVLNKVKTLAFIFFGQNKVSFDAGMHCKHKWMFNLHI